jgi:putative membrane protein
MSAPAVPVAPVQRGNRYKRALESKLLDLHDSVARDQLANERTYLAYLRTSFTISAIGVLMTRLQITDPNNNTNNNTAFKVLSLCYIGIGFLSIIAGFYRYIHVEATMERGLYPTGGICIGLLSIAGIIAFAATFIVLVI